jgi:hypothetical protein
MACCTSTTPCLLSIKNVSSAKSRETPGDSGSDPVHVPSTVEDHQFPCKARENNWSSQQNVLCEDSRSRPGSLRGDHIFEPPIAANRSRQILRVPKDGRGTTVWSHSVDNKLIMGLIWYTFTQIILQPGSTSCCFGCFPSSPSHMSPAYNAHRCK